MGKADPFTNSVGAFDHAKKNLSLSNPLEDLDESVLGTLADLLYNLDRVAIKSLRHVSSGMNGEL